MADPRLFRASSRLATRAYALRPVRSIAARVGTWAIVCAACLATGAAVSKWHGQREAQPIGPCVATPSEELVQAELARARLALAQEEAARAAMQKAADESAAEVSRLGTELRFLRGQRAARP